MMPMPPGLIGRNFTAAVVVCRIFLRTKRKTIGISRIIMPPCEIAATRFLKSVGRDGVEAEAPLARQPEAAEPRSVELFQLRGDVLPTAPLRIDDPQDLRVQLMRGLRARPVMFPPSGEQGADRLTERVAGLSLAHPLDGVAAAKRQQRVAHPRAPLLIAAESNRPASVRRARRP